MDPVVECLNVITPGVSCTHHLNLKDEYQAESTTPARRKEIAEELSEYSVYRDIFFSSFCSDQKVFHSEN